MNKRIILASVSPRRKELLAQIGLEYEIMPSSAREETASREPAQMVQELSMLKAEAVFESLTAGQKKDMLVIGADTMVAFEGQMLGKPADEEEAARMLQSLQGNTHQVFTGVTLIWQERNTEGDWEKRQKSFVEETSVTMYPMSFSEIQSYISTGEPMDKAGAYGIQGRCAAWIEKISGDYSNVVGLPVGRLYQELKKIGIWKGIDI